MAIEGNGAKNAAERAEILNSAGLEITFRPDGENVVAKLSDKQAAALQQLQTTNPALFSRTFGSISSAATANNKSFFDAGKKQITFTRDDLEATAIYDFQQHTDVTEAVLNGKYYDKQAPSAAVIAAPQPKPQAVATLPAAPQVSAAPAVIEQPATNDVPISAGAFKESDKTLIREIQNNLKGLNPDGKIGRHTLDAYANRKMNVDAANGVDMSVPDKPLPTKESILAAEHNALKSELAKALGRDATQIKRDGKLDANDIQDIAKFQKMNGLENQTGTLDKETLAALEKANGGKQIDAVAQGMIRLDQDTKNKAPQPDSTPINDAAQARAR